jgi:hypothetical protein
MRKIIAIIIVTIIIIAILKWLIETHNMILIKGKMMPISK